MKDLKKFRKQDLHFKIHLFYIDPCSALFILTNRICYENDSAERVKEIKEIEESKKYVFKSLA